MSTIARPSNQSNLFGEDAEKARREMLTARRVGIAGRAKKMVLFRLASQTGRTVCKVMRADIVLGTAALALLGRGNIL